MSQALYISPLDAAHRMHETAGFAVVDVRSPVEFAAEHADGAINLPLDRLDDAALTGAVGPGSAVAFICQSGARAIKACSRLAGVRPGAMVIEGGTSAWLQSGLPVIRRPCAMSLERQVRVAAGSMVLLGTLLGLFIHTAWLAVPLIVGSGLIFAGITNTCGLGLLLTQCPWNQRILKGASHE